MLVPDDFLFLTNGSFPEFRENFRDIYGLDTAGLKLPGQDGYLAGYVLESPILEAVNTRFGADLPVGGRQKPYRAHWMIEDGSLLLCYVNGVLNNRAFDTDWILPNSYAIGQRLLKEFSGQFHFVAQQTAVEGQFKDMVSESPFILMMFEKGNLVSLEGNACFSCNYNAPDYQIPGLSDPDWDGDELPF